MVSAATSPAGLSVWEANLLEHVTEHIARERDLLADYRRATEAADSDYLTYLFELILEDEARHGKDLRLMKGLSLWPLLIELMEDDTRKHQKILRFIHRQLSRQDA